MNRTTLYLLTSGIFLTATAELVVAGIVGAIARDLNVSIGMAGQLITAYSLAYAIGTPVVLSLTAGMSRKKLLVGSLSLFIATGVCSSFEIGFGVMLLLRCLTGLCSGVFFVVSFSSVAKLASPNKIGRAIGTLILGFSCALVLGVPAGIAIADWLNWHYIFVFLSIFSLPILAGMVRSFPDIEGDAAIPLRKQFGVLTNPVILTGIGITFFRDAGNSVMYTFLTPFLGSILQLNDAAIGIMMLLFGLFGVAGSRFGGYATDRWGAKITIFICLAIHIAALTIVSFLSFLRPISILLFALWMLSMFIAAPAIQTYLIQISHRSSNLVLSVNTSFTQLGLAAGAAVGGATANLSSGVSYHPLAAGMIISIGLIAAIRSFSINRRDPFVRYAKGKNTEAHPL